jgi:hypothetical protein
MPEKGGAGRELMLHSDVGDIRIPAWPGGCIDMQIPDDIKRRVDRDLLA